MALCRQYHRTGIRANTQVAPGIFFSHAVLAPASDLSPQVPPPTSPIHV